MSRPRGFRARRPGESLQLFTDLEDLKPLDDGSRGTTDASEMQSHHEQEAVEIPTTLVVKHPRGPGPTDYGESLGTISKRVHFEDQEIVKPDQHTEKCSATITPRKECPGHVPADVPVDMETFP